MKADHEFKNGQRRLIIEAENLNDANILGVFARGEADVDVQYCQDPDYKFPLIILTRKA